MSTKRACARCKKPYWTRSYCSKCEQLVARQLRRRRKSEKVSAPEGALSPPIPLGQGSAEAEGAQMPTSEGSDAGKKVCL